MNQSISDALTLVASDENIQQYLTLLQERFKEQLQSMKSVENAADAAFLLAVVRDLGVTQPVLAELVRKGSSLKRALQTLVAATLFDFEPTVSAYPEGIKFEVLV